MSVSAKRCESKILRLSSLCRSPRRRFLLPEVFRRRFGAGQTTLAGRRVVVSALRHLRRCTGCHAERRICAGRAVLHPADYEPIRRFAVGFVPRNLQRVCHRICGSGCGREARENPSSLLVGRRRSSGGPPAPWLPLKTISLIGGRFQLRWLRSLNEQSTPPAVSTGQKKPACCQRLPQTSSPAAALYPRVHRKIGLPVYAAKARPSRNPHWQR